MTAVNINRITSQPPHPRQSRTMTAYMPREGLPLGPWFSDLLRARASRRHAYTLTYTLTIDSGQSAH